MTAYAFVFSALSRAAAALLICATLGLPALATAAFADAGVASASRHWRPEPDTPYPQEIGEKISTPQPVTGVALLGNDLFAVTGGELKRLSENRLIPVPGAPRDIRRLRTLENALWVAAPSGAYRFQGGPWERVDGQAFVDFCLHQGQVHGATAEDVFRFERGQFVNVRPAGGYLSSDSTVVMEDFSQVLADPVQIGPIRRIASYSGTLYVLRPGSLGVIDDRTFVPDPIDWGALPSPETRDLLTFGSRLFVATDRGLGVLRGMAMTGLRGADGLCYEETTCLSPGFADDLWIGTSRGAIRMVSGAFHYFGADHWLPGNAVQDIACGDDLVAIATDRGLGLIRYEPYTLAKKAAFFERELDRGGFKRLGFVHKLFWSDQENGWLREISDNDGGNTSHYLAAMTFKYAATRDESARREAVDAFNSMAWLQEIGPGNGFIARAVWSVTGDPGERSTRGSGGLPAKWYPTPDGRWFWKGDTSSDEVNAHFFAISLFHDLAAQGPEKQRAKKHLVNLAAHIVDNGWVLRDVDGKPTRWGRWDPEYLQRPYGFEARGLNGMEAQTYMHVAFALSGEPRFESGLDQLLRWRYHTYTVRQRLTFPPDQVVPWDDELAFFCYEPLLRYARRPELRSIYLRSLERTWEVVRIQQIPFYNFVYGAATGNDCEVPEAVQHLREWSLDLVNHNYRNSHRHDLFPRPGYVPYSGGTRAISPREAEAKWGARNSLQYDGGENSRAITPPIGWLEDYWMGRYHGFIQAPGTTDAALLQPTVPATPTPAAKPYAGPPRPVPQ